jgi:hypothetical protein
VQRQTCGHYSGLGTDRLPPTGGDRSASVGPSGMAGHAACDSADTGPSGWRAGCWRDCYPDALPPIRHGSDEDAPRRSGRANAPAGHAGRARSARSHRTSARPGGNGLGPDAAGRIPGSGRRHVRIGYAGSVLPSSEDRACGVQNESACRLRRCFAKRDRRRGGSTSAQTELPLAGHRPPGGWMDRLHDGSQGNPRVFNWPTMVYESSIDLAVSLVESRLVPPHVSSA